MGGTKEPGLIHAVNGSLFRGADPGAIAWTRLPPKIVTVQSLLYASLTTSLFAAFLAMLGKQWVNQYLRNHGDSAATGSESWMDCRSGTSTSPSRVCR